MTISTYSWLVIRCTGRIEQWRLVRQGAADYVFLYNNSWCMISKKVSSYCYPEVEYIMISCRPHYLQREYTSVFFVTVNIPPQSEVGTKIALNEPNFYQHVKCASKGERTLDHLYSTHRDAYKALPRTPFGKSDHNSILLLTSKN